MYRLLRAQYQGWNIYFGTFCIKIFPLPSSSCIVGFVLFEVNSLLISLMYLSVEGVISLIITFTDIQLALPPFLRLKHNKIRCCVLRTI